MEGNTITLQEIRELFADTKGKSWEIAEIIEIQFLTLQT